MRLAAVVSWPFSTTRPVVGVSSSPMRLSRVDLPEPDWPMTEANSPASIVNDTSCRATVLATVP